MTNEANAIGNWVCTFMSFPRFNFLLSWLSFSRYQWRVLITHFVPMKLSFHISHYNYCFIIVLYQHGIDLLLVWCILLKNPLKFILCFQLSVKTQIDSKWLYPFCLLYMPVDGWISEFYMDSHPYSQEKTTKR